MPSNRLLVQIIGVLIGLLSSNAALASATSQSKRSKLDADVHAIGCRKITHDTNFYSLEREKELSKSMVREEERTSKLLIDPALTDYVGRLAQKVAHNSDAHFPITVSVIDSDAVEAFTV